MKLGRYRKILLFCLIFLTSCASLQNRKFSFVDDLVVARYPYLNDLQSVVSEFVKAGYRIERHGEKGDVIAFYLPETNAINFVAGHTKGCIKEFNHSIDKKHNKKWDNSHININDVCF